METIFSKIKLTGGRLTKVRRAIIELLYRKNCLTSAQEIREELAAHHLCPNRSTIFRELSYLSSHRIIQKETIADVQYFEIPKTHHHHLVCLRCHHITAVDMNNHLADQEAAIARKNNFTIINHSLEFYGYCQKCRA